MSMPRLIGVVALIGALAVALYLWSRDPEESSPLTQAVATQSARAPAPVAHAESSVRPANTETVHDPDAHRASPTVQWMLALADWLESRGDAESLTVAAILLSSADRWAAESQDPRPDLQQRTLALLQRLAALGPGDPEVHFVGLSLCEGVRASKMGCDPRPFRQALIAADPANAIVWMPALERAVDGKDLITQMAILSRMAGAERFDMYIAPVSGMMNRAIEAAPVAKPVGASDTERQALEPGSLVFATLQLPNVRALRAACVPSANSAIIGSCNYIVRTMRSADASITRAMGLGIGLAFAVPGSPLAQELNEAQRVQRWQLLQRSVLPQDLLPTADMMHRLGGEPQALEEALRLAGVPLTPPEGWTAGP